MDNSTLLLFYFPSAYGAEIDDSTISESTTWSSSKIDEEITDIIDDDVISEDKTWSSKKIHDEDVNIDCGTF